MKRFAIPSVFLITLPALLLAHSLYAAEPQVTWTHVTTSPIGPAFWGQDSAAYGTCGTTINSSLVEVGMRQTPIDIDTTKTTKSSTPVLTFQYLDTPMEVENTGHVVEVVYPAGSTLRLGQLSSSSSNSLPQASDEFQLLQFHFHAPSEHTINGKHADLEVHLVHQNQLGDLAVVGVMMNIGSEYNSLVESIMKLSPLANGSLGMDGVTLNARDLLPDDKSYYMYSGSLTTPPCTEGVRWFLMKNPVTVSPYSVQQMHKIVGLFPSYEGFQNNNRPIVPLHGRAVVSDR
jgi:carbonic anhydrase